MQIDGNVGGSTDEIGIVRFSGGLKEKGRGGGDREDWGGGWKVGDGEGWKGDGGSDGGKWGEKIWGIQKEKGRKEGKRKSEEEHHS